MLVSIYLFDEYSSFELPERVFFNISFSIIFFQSSHGFISLMGPINPRENHIIKDYSAKAEMNPSREPNLKTVMKEMPASRLDGSLKYLKQ